MVELFALSVVVRAELSDTLVELFALSVEVDVGLYDAVVELVGLYEPVATLPPAIVPLFVLVLDGVIVCESAGVAIASALAEAAKRAFFISPPKTGLWSWPFDRRSERDTRQIEKWFIWD
ncbi:hypothetical protein [Sphingomonas sp. PAMC 26621]|uniref:hypothetical protein n=1 Tax=Sphingomonas sp. PAMC 26621 TaxID=1112213 RepID=UPI000287B9CC|nr:hypothetical protein [Sphingomonas sp. PAMC 26621]